MENTLLEIEALDFANSVAARYAPLPLDLISRSQIPKKLVISGVDMTSTIIEGRSPLDKESKNARSSS